MKIKSTIVHLLIPFVTLAFNLNACTNTSTLSPPINNVSTQSLSFDESTAFALMYENEWIFMDSETIANQKSNFNTKALLDGTLNTTTNITGALNVNLDVSTEILSSLGRTNFIVKTSDVISSRDSNGFITSTIGLEFTNKETGKTKSNTISKKYLKDSEIEIEQNLTINFGTYNKTATRKKNITTNSTTIETQSKASLSNGTIMDLNESRIKNNEIDGSGTINIKTSSGTTTTYTFISKVDATGKLSVTAKNSLKNTEVKIVENTKATIKATITSNGNTKSSELNIEIASENSLKTS